MIKIPQFGFDFFEEGLNKKVGKEELQEKPAKQFRGTVEAANKGGKAGSYNSIEKLFRLMTDWGNNPIVKVIMMFCQYISDHINAQFLEAAEYLAEKLWGDESRSAMGTMAEKVEAFTSGVKMLVEALVWVDKWFSENMPALESWWKEWGWIFQSLSGNILTVGQNAGSLERVMEECDDKWDELVKVVTELVQELNDL